MSMMLRTRLRASWNKRLDLVRGHYKTANVIFRFLVKSTAMTGSTVLALLMLFPSLVPRLGKSVACMEIAGPAGSFLEQER